MKYIKTYEAIMRAPKVGDYIITNELIGYGKFDKHNLAQVTRVEGDVYFVKVESETEDVPGYRILVLKLIQINCWSDDIEELKQKMAANKYNL